MKAALLGLCLVAAAGLSFFSGLLYSEGQAARRLSARAHPGFAVAPAHLPSHRSNRILPPAQGPEPRSRRLPPKLERRRKGSGRRQGPTLVTGLFDIGRGDWWLYRRPYNYYLKYLESLLSLEVDLVIFIQPKGVAFVRDFRAGRGLAARTHVVPMELEQLELVARHRGPAEALIAREQANWRPHWDAGIKGHPEAASALYDLVVNSKPFLVSLAARLDPFASQFFYWMDGGYGHGKRGVFPASQRWLPKELMTAEPGRSRVSLISLHQRPAFNETRIEDLYRQDKAFISGGFFGGPKDAIFALYHHYSALFRRLLERGFLDDDQTLMVLLIREHPELFNLIHGDWYDGVVKFAL